MRTRRENRQERPLIGEMMLAKAVLEEKNAFLDEKDERIRFLSSRLRLLEEQRSAEHTRSLTDGECRSKEHLLSHLLADIVELLDRYPEDAGGESDGGFRHDFISMIRKRHGLERIDSVDGAIDPEIHCVIEVEKAQRGPFRFDVVTPGYRLCGLLVRPALVKVTKDRRFEEQ